MIKSVFHEFGRIEEARRNLLRLGTLKFGPPDEATRDRLVWNADIILLEAMLDHVLTAGSWEEVMAVNV